MMNLRCAFGFALVASILVGCKVLSPTSTLAQPHSPVPTQTQPTAPATEPSASSPPTEAPVVPADATQVALSSQTPLDSCEVPGEVDHGQLSLAFVAAWDGDHDIYTIRADGADLRQQTFNDSGDIGPAWSPNGSRLAYVANAFTEPRLIIAQADGLQGKVVAPELEVSSIEPVWSPTGDKIGFRSMDDLFVVDLETEEAVNLTRAIDYSVSTVRISPGGRLAAFSANVPGQEPSQRLFTVNVDGSGLRDIGFREGDVFDPRWHPVEDKLLFEGWSAGEGARLYVASLDGAVTQLPMVPLYRPPRASWSPDGSMIAYAVHLSGFDSTGERLQLNSLHVATADGGKDLVLLEPPDEPDSGLTIVEAVWAPDSRHIAYSIPSVSGGFGEVDLYVLNICDGASVAVVEEIDGFSTPSWHPLP